MTYPPLHPEASPPAPLLMSAAEFAYAYPEESETVERKAGAGAKPLQETSVAFSNSRGGVILIGVDDSGAILGRDTTPGLVDDIHRALRDARGLGRYEIHTLGVNGKTVTVVAVARRVEGFAQTSDGRVLVRNGTRNDALLGSDLARFLKERALESFESTSTQHRLDDIVPNRLAALAERFGWQDPDEYAQRLQERGLATGGRLTVAGALCLLEEPPRGLGKPIVELFRYGDDSGQYDRRTEFAGPVDEQVERVTEAVTAELGSEIVVLGVRRHELPRIPARVIREAVANAVAHRDYEQRRSVQIHIHPNEVRITSPGGLPEPVTEKNIRETQSARNERILRVLRRQGLAEDAGLGVDAMQDLMRDALLDPPRFHDTGHSVEVVLPIRSAVTPAERAWVREIVQRGLIEPADRILLVHAARGNVLTNSVAREVLALDPLSARAALRRLRDAGFLVQRGERAGTSYVLAAFLTPPAGLRLSDTELEEVVMEIAREGEPVSNARVRSRTGLDRVEALRVLDSLVAQNRLRRVGERRGTRYVLP
jgi:ATP-dependent DNA helicase RecG